MQIDAQPHIQSFQIHLAPHKVKQDMEMSRISHASNTIVIKLRWRIE